MAAALDVELQLYFHGPYTFTPGASSLFACAERHASGVYLWTIRSDRDGQHYVHYVGEAEDFARRQREHLTHVLGLNYGVLDPAAARRGEAHWVWRGMWRDRTAAGPGEALARYSSLAGAVSAYVEALEVFVAPIAGDRQTRRRVEQALAGQVRRTPVGAGALYPPDNRVSGAPGHSRIRLHIAAGAPIAGLDAAVVIEPTPARQGVP
jgi:hypothetical protein